MPGDILNSLSPPPQFDATRCAGGRDGVAGCRICVDTCPVGAINARQYPDGTVVSIDPWACRRCGACTAACPTSALARSFDDDLSLRERVTAALEDRADAPVVALGCSHTMESVAGSSGRVAVSLRSILVIDETLLLHTLRAGAAGVAVMPCDACDHGAADLLERPIELTRAITGVHEAVVAIADDGSRMSRQALERYTSERAGRRALEALPGHTLRPEPTRREVLAGLLGEDLASTEVALPSESITFGTAWVDAEACTLCGACARMCPTNALGYDASEGRLDFRAVDCTACGLCTAACPEDAVTLDIGLDRAGSLVDRRTLVTDEVVRCAGCGDPYLPARLLAHAQRVVQEATGAPRAPRSELERCPSCKVTEPMPATPAPAASDGLGRRGFLKALGATTAGAALLPLMSARPAQSQPTAPDPAKRWAMVIDLERCIGCHACTNICKAENNVPIGGFRDWVEEHELGSGTTAARPYFLPKLCNHCESPGCLRACPTGAIYQRDDGIVGLDSSICIACQACMQGCPYGMTFYNSARNTADKCNYCEHRVDAGLNPACVDICPSQCRIFGDINDPDSAISTYLATHETAVIRPDIGLRPHTHYVGLPGELNR